VNPSVEARHPMYSKLPTAAGADGVMLGLVVGDTPPEVNDAVGTGKTVMPTLIVCVIKMVD